MTGFPWKNGHRIETMGLWIWSDVFTYDFQNGDKIAIILLDTQGISYDQFASHDNTAIFALSMMSASIQCFNLMTDIREEDLQHLKLFSEYGRLALNKKKPFQKLLFIVRDWLNSDSEIISERIPYGDSQKFVNKTFSQNNEQTHKMMELRTRIMMSFDTISAFLMPHIGVAIHGHNFTGNLQQISSGFREYLKVLVPMIFAPENLIVKEVNGQKVRARDLVNYLQAYMEIFNTGTLSQPQAVLMVCRNFCTFCILEVFLLRKPSLLNQILNFF